MQSLFDDRFHAPLFGGEALISAPAPADGDSIVGTTGDDNLFGTDGDDTINGLAGDDTITGGAGSDRLIGGGGHDWITDDDGGSDSLYGGGDSDSLYLYRNFSSSPPTAEHVLLDGGDGDDSLHLSTSTGDGVAYAMDATVLGGLGADYLEIGIVEKVSVDAGAGDDDILTYIGDSRTLTLGDGADLVELEGLQGAMTAMVITDFKTGDDGDALSMRYMLLASTLRGWDRDNPFGEGYLRLVQRGADTVMQIDADGGGDNWSDIIVFQHTRKADFTAFNLDGYPPNGDEPAGQLLIGTEAAETLSGTEGADTLIGLGGDDWLFGGVSDDSLSGGDGNDLLSGDGGKDTLDGGAGDDSLSSQGAALMLGGDGDDTMNAYVGQIGPAVTLDGGAGDDQLILDISPFVPSGRALAHGGDGDDSFFVQGVGHATLDGGDGDDHFELSRPSSQLVLTLGAGRDTVKIDEAAVGDTAVVITDFAAGPAGDQLDLYDFLKHHLVGWDFSSNPFAEGYLRLTAEGKDTLVQWSAAGDGAWGDLYLLRGVSPSALTQENLGGYPSDGSEPIGTLIKGGRGDDTLTSGDGPDTVNGAKGFDHLYGGAGDDHLLGAGGNDTLYGGYGADVMNGGAGDDLLDGSDGGADTLIGGAGDDDLAMHRYNTPPPANGLIVLQGGTGDDYVTYSANWLNQDRVSVDGGVGDDWIIFDQAVAAATVEGGDGNDTITGGYGAMTIDGGAGDDLITAQVGGPAIQVKLGAGADVLNLSGGFSSFFPGSPVEATDFTAQDRLGLRTLIAQNYFGVTDPFNDGHLRLAQVGPDTVLQGVAENGGWFSLLKLDGVDAAKLSSAQLDGYATGPVWLIGTDGSDDLALRRDFTHVDTGKGDDTVVGSAAGDVIIGGQGADLLTGRGGGDTFQYGSVADSSPAAHDRITDLAADDVIDLSRIDADTSTFADDAFHMVAAFTGHAGELTLSYNQATDQTTMSGDVNGDGVADLVITIDHDRHSFSHFVL